MRYLTLPTTARIFLIAVFAIILLCAHFHDQGTGKSMNDAPQINSTLEPAINSRLIPLDPELPLITTPRPLNKLITAPLPSAAVNSSLSEKLAEDNLKLIIRDVRSSARTEMAWFTIISWIVLATLYLYYLLRVKHQHQRKELQAIIDSQENERSRIARDLHDGIVQDLHVLAEDAKKLAVEPETGEESLHLKLERTKEKVRLLAHQLIPRYLETESLNQALEKLARKLNRLKGISIEYSSNRDDQHTSSEEKVHVYRIAQEWIQNAIKQADVSRIDVALVCREQELQLWVEDNGRGLESPNTPSEGIGLQSVAARAKTIGAIVHYENKETDTEHGTEGGLIARLILRRKKPLPANFPLPYWKSLLRRKKSRHKLHV